jgi:hypothetical protein
LSVKVRQYTCIYLNRIGDVIVSVLASSVVGLGSILIQRQPVFALSP